ncbi:hypothetical protein B296_00029457 [Ensete ventricosum]|uniref:Uncharacterized protein n=1 Tax=Ensete ventricosum TaxID=4639 RepID=A0A426XPV4_ENSVE|nr:hypothetical protein B296_00029457 [Ensete ventricosum]
MQSAGCGSSFVFSSSGSRSSSSDSSIGFIMESFPSIGSRVHCNANKGPSPIYHEVLLLSISLSAKHDWEQGVLKVVLILRASRFSHSSWIHVKEIAAFTVGAVAL